MNEIKQLLTDDLNGLRFNGEGEEPELRDWAVDEREKQGKLDRILRNSKVLVKVVALFHNLIGRFRYLFTMAITLSKEKKNFHDLVVQIGNRYNPNHILLEGREEELDPMMTNFQEMDGIISECKDGEVNRSVLELIFADLRYPMMFRKCWLEEEIREGIKNNTIF